MDLNRFMHKALEQIYAIFLIRISYNACSVDESNVTQNIGTPVIEIGCYHEVHLLLMSVLHNKENLT